MWAEGDVLIVDDHSTHEWDAEDLGLRDWMSGMNPRTSALIPVGEGNSSLGLIWITQLDSPRFWSRTEISMIQHVAGNVAYGLIQGHLISGQQQVLRQLQQLDQAKTDFLATVNHELRTPLTSITAYLDMIRDGSGGKLPNEVNRMLDIIVRNSERLRRLIEDMLAVSKPDYEATGLHLAPSRVGHTLRIITAALRPSRSSGRWTSPLTLTGGTRTSWLTKCNWNRSSPTWYQMPSSSRPAGERFPSETAIAMTTTETRG
ncbi:histidine kinase dimerization/phospho-acceptor domain-containing protein [Arthrobacter sp. SA17]